MSCQGDNRKRRESLHPGILTAKKRAGKSSKKSDAGKDETLGKKGES